MPAKPFTATDPDYAYRAARRDGRIGEGCHATGGVPVRPKSVYSDERPALSWSPWQTDYSALGEPSAD